MWDPQQYLVFGDERTRPFVELLRRIDVESPRRVVDLGCGPGTLTALLAVRWPDARVEGVDSSPEMIDAARELDRPGRLTFAVGDVADWSPTGPLDVVVSNATLQWLPEHVDLLSRFVGWLAPGGWLAFQVPGSFLAPSHRILAELRRSPRWAALVGEGAERHLAVEDMAGYAAVLLGRHPELRVDAWETTYLHLLGGPDPVLEWVKGAGLRPVLARLDDADRAAFLAEYGARLRDAYPTGPNGLTAFPFRRIFVVAHRD